MQFILTPLFLVLMSFDFDCYLTAGTTQRQGVGNKINWGNTYSDEMKVRRWPWHSAVSCSFSTRWGDDDHVNLSQVIHLNLIEVIHQLRFSYLFVFLMVFPSFMSWAGMETFVAFSANCFKIFPCRLVQIVSYSFFNVCSLPLFHLFMWSSPDY